MTGSLLEWEANIQDPAAPSLSRAQVGRKQEGDRVRVNERENERGRGQGNSGKRESRIEDRWASSVSFQ